MKANRNPCLLLFQALQFPTVKQKVKKRKKKKASTNPYLLLFHVLLLPDKKKKREANADPYLLHFQALKFPRVKRKTKRLMQTLACYFSRH